MSSISKAEDNWPHFSGYEWDISDGASSHGSGGNDSSISNESTDEEPSQSDECNPDSRWFGCSQQDSPAEDVDALAESGNEDDSRYGIILIGCSIQDMGLSSYQATIDATYTADIAHIENITLFDGVPVPNAGKDEDEDVEAMGGIRGCSSLPPPSRLLLFLFIFLLALVALVLYGLLRWHLLC
ncbi:hypothetical protein BJX63DRAFT_361535 [Aspergillus granulosus]|uniref:Uncharacterized protein n=1 Tax=Aspergillus granulosus TaxID=176169 RepID=A0ABR4HWA5_9EURO